MALGQSQPGVGYQTALRNIANARSGAAQRGAGEANILRAQSQQAAQDQLAGLLQAQGAGDAEQAAQAAAAAQSVREANQAATQQAQESLRINQNRYDSGLATITEARVRART